MYIGLKAIIEKDGKVLILKDPNLPEDTPDFPGGKIHEEDTDLIESLKREVLEESGLEIDVGEPFHIWTHKFGGANEKKYKIKDIFLVAFKCKYKSGEVALSEEHDAFKWVDENDIDSLNPNDSYTKALKVYFKKHQ